MLSKYIWTKAIIKSGIDERDFAKIVFERKHTLDSYEKLVAEKCSKKTIFETLNTSRATIYRWKRAYKKNGLGGLEPKSKAPLHYRKPMRDDHWF